MVKLVVSIGLIGERFVVPSYRGFRQKTSTNEAHKTKCLWCSAAGEKAFRNMRLMPHMRLIFLVVEQEKALC